MPEVSSSKANPSEHVIEQVQRRSFAHEIGSIGQLEILNADSRIPLRFTAPDRHIQLALAGSQSESFHVWKTDSSTGFTSTPTMPADVLTIRFVNKGAMFRVGRQGSDLVMAFDQALLTSFELMRYEQATPGFSALTAAIRPDAIIEASRSLFGGDTISLPRFESVFDLNAVGLRTIRSTLTSLHRYLSAPRSIGDLVTPLLEEIFLYQIAGSWPHDAATAKPYSSRADKAVKIVLDYIEENLSRKITIREMASAAGISVRVLQTAFKRSLGCSPSQFLIARRLDRVSADLQCSEGKTIRQIARSWGFVHMSDFARRYRERYGCLPSAHIDSGWRLDEVD